MQRPVDGQILTCEALFNWCTENIKNIKTFYVKQEEIEAHRAILELRFSKASTIAGTKDNHFFCPLSVTKIKISRVSWDEESSFIVEDGKKTQPQESIQPGQYVSCIYDGKWWLGNVVDKNEEFEDVKVQFMHPSGPATSFAWPTREDICWVPLAHV